MLQTTEASSRMGEGSKSGADEDSNGDVSTGLGEALGDKTGRGDEGDEEGNGVGNMSGRGKGAVARTGRGGVEAVKVGVEGDSGCMVTGVSEGGGG